MFYSTTEKNVEVEVKNILKFQQFILVAFLYCGSLKRKHRCSRSQEENLCMRQKFMQKAFDFFMQIIQRLLKPELVG
jgi:hypothetical protein